MGCDLKIADLKHFPSNLGEPGIILLIKTFFKLEMFLTFKACAKQAKSFHLENLYLFTIYAKKTKLVRLYRYRCICMTTFPHNIPHSVTVRMSNDFVDFVATIRHI